LVYPELIDSHIFKLFPVQLITYRPPVPVLQLQSITDKVRHSPSWDVLPNRTRSKY